MTCCFMLSSSISKYRCWGTELCWYSLLLKVESDEANINVSRRFWNAASRADICDQNALIFVPQSQICLKYLKKLCCTNEDFISKALHPFSFEESCIQKHKEVE